MVQSRQAKQRGQASLIGLLVTIAIIMILAAPPLIGQMVEWSGNFQSSFLALGAFTLLAWIVTLGIHQHESDRPV